MIISRLALLGISSLFLAQLGNTLPSGATLEALSPNTRAEYYTSVNLETYQPNASLYHLGYKGDDWSRPFAKFWNLSLDPISDELQKGITESPYASALCRPSHQSPAASLNRLFRSLQPSRGS
jgi:hypothetical protein